MSVWLNADKQHSDWIDDFDQPAFQDSVTVDDSIKRQGPTSRGCPVLELRRIGGSNSTSAFMGSKDCDSKARVLCTRDLSKPTKVEKHPNLSCLQPTEITSKPGEKVNMRRKRDSNVKMDKRIELNKNGKILVNMANI